MINKVTLLGYVGDTPEVRSFEGGTKMARLRIATNEKVYIRKSQELREHTEWHTVIVWGDSATFADRYIHKGTQLYVEGALRSREVVTKEGHKQRVTEIAGKEIKIVNQPKEYGELKKEVDTPSKQEHPPIVPPLKDIDDIPF